MCLNAASISDECFITEPENPILSLSTSSMGNGNDVKQIKSTCNINHIKSFRIDLDTSCMYLSTLKDLGPQNPVNSKNSN